ncbi:MAG: hypothetical protein Q7V31_12165 [Parvibaculum sp.]|uniref:hypothetical protein n=1 Tax=Parvibaculum sp. TaxID=2024848 RepID=UPI0027167F8B|nr:hypothetical protein [Parvibaculum sp.]MDO8839672.1 hypothetical protein [Parvibaculum sp.]
MKMSCCHRTPCEDRRPRAAAIAREAARISAARVEAARCADIPCITIQTTTSRVVEEAVDVQVKCVMRYAVIAQIKTTLMAKTHRNVSAMFISRRGAEAHIGRLIAANRSSHRSYFLYDLLENRKVEQ